MRLISGLWTTHEGIRALEQQKCHVYILRTWIGHRSYPVLEMTFLPWHKGHTHKKKTEWNSALHHVQKSRTNTLKPMEDCRIQIPERAKHNVTQVAPLLKNMCLACASKRHIHCRQEGFLGLSRMFFLSQLCISWNHMPKLGFRAWTPKKKIRTKSNNTWKSSGGLQKRHWHRRV
jgi:hypothetical protein